MFYFPQLRYFTPRLRESTNVRQIAQLNIINALSTILSMTYQRYSCFIYF